MKKIFTLILVVTLLTMAAMPSLAQGRYYGNQTSRSRAYDSRTYYDYGYRNRTVWDKHRDKLTVAGGAAGGAILGALIGGGKGAAIGALAGAGGSALYTYKIRNNRRPF